MWYSVTKLRVFGAEDVLFFVGLIPARSQAEPGLARLDKSLFHAWREDEERERKA